MKLQPETLAYSRKLTLEERREFLAYLRDADANIEAEVNHIDNEFVHDLPKSNESE